MQDEEDNAAVMDAPSTTISKDIFLSHPSDPSTGLKEKIWDVPDTASLPRVPPLYTFLPTRVVVSAQKRSPNEAAQQIAFLLQAESLDATFFNDQATAVVRCPDNLSFVIQLYRADNDNSNGSTSELESFVGFIVEVRKKRGGSLHFQKYARMILRSAASENVSNVLAKPVRLRTAPVVTIPSKNNDDSEVERDVKYTLDRAALLLDKDRFDANVLGLESLVLLTDKECTGFERAICASRCLLEGTEYRHLQQMIVKCLWPKQNSEDFDDEGECVFEREQWESMKGRALIAIGNALSHASAPFNTMQWNAEDGTNLAQILMEEIQPAAETNLENSFHAIQLLKSIIALGNREAESTLMGPDIISIVRDAERVGRSRHALLGKEATQLLAVLEGGVSK